MAKKAVNLYLDRDTYDRFKAACEKLGTTVSEFVNDQMAGNLEFVEIAAETKDPQKAAQAFKSSFADTMMREIIELGDALRMVQAETEGKEKAT